MQKHRYEDLTWPEVNEAVKAGRIPVLPVGATEQHGHHLPIKMDLWQAAAVSEEAAGQRPDRLLAMPPVAYGYVAHTMDFPGSISIHHETLIRYVLDILKSLAYHGFEKMIVLNGHGSNMPPLDLACRRLNIETDAQAALTGFWTLTFANPGFTRTWRESHFPGGCSHACELETSMALHLDSDIVQMDKAVNHEAEYNTYRSKYHFGDLEAHGPVSITSWTSEYTETGVCGEAKLGTAEKGKMIFDESVKNLIEFADEFFTRPNPVRRDHHESKRLSEMPG